MSACAKPRRPLIAGNWKMVKTRPEARQFVEALYQALDRPASDGEVLAADVMLCPSFVLLETTLASVAKQQAPFLIAAQTMESHDKGAYTGEVSPVMLNELGIQHVILGHSERRQYYNETDAALNLKVKAAFAHGLMPVLCVGETLEQREQGVTDTVIRTQLTQGPQGMTESQAASMVLAYEPVWAIGTGKVCESDEAQRVCALIRQTVSTAIGTMAAQQIRILYGGSVKPDNAVELLAKPDIDGALVGGASLEADVFATIVQAASVCLQPAS